MNPMFMAEAESEPMASSDPYTLWALQERQKQKKTQLSRKKKKFFIPLPCGSSDNVDLLHQLN